MTLSTKALLARAAKFISDIGFETDWRLYTMMFEVESVAEGIPRLYRSQSFHDPDYRNCVAKLLLGIAVKDEGLAIQFVKYVISDSVNLKDETMVAKDPDLLRALDLIGEGEFVLPAISVSTKKYLDVKVLPGDFYIELQDQINKAFAYGIFPAVQILSRKFLENLIVDILRKKYGGHRVELFYDTGRRRFLGFEALLRNVHDRIGDFASASPAFDEGFLKKIDEFREQGNSSAHTIELNLGRQDMQEDSKDLEYIVKVLVKVLDSV